MLPDAAIPAVLSEAGYIYRQVGDLWIDFLLWVILAATWANLVAALQTHTDACRRTITSANVSDTKQFYFTHIFSDCIHDTFTGVPSQFIELINIRVENVSS